MIIVVDKHNFSQHAHLMDQAHRLRKLVFVDEMKWKVPVIDGRETDEFDHEDAVHMLCLHAGAVVGYQRMLPTTREFMLPKLFSFLAQIDAPTGRNVYEWTRHCVAPAHREAGRGLSAVGSELTVGLVEWSLQSGVDTIVVEFSPQWILPALQFQFRVEALGLLHQMEGQDFIALALRFDGKTLSALRAARRSNEPVLFDANVPAANRSMVA